MGNEAEAVQQEDLEEGVSLEGQEAGDQSGGEQGEQAGGEGGEQGKQKTPEELAEEERVAENERIRQEAYDKREANRQRQEAERRAEQAEAEVAKLKGGEGSERPVVPPKPTDDLDPNYGRDMEAWADAREAAAKWDAQQGTREADDTRQREEQQRAEAEAFGKRADDYAARAKTMNVDADALAKAGQAVAEVGMSPDMFDYVLDDQHGPEITLYLGNNLAELQKLNNMPPMQAAAYIEREIKPKAKIEKPKDPPAPVDTSLGGGSVPTNDDDKWGTYS